MSTRALAILTLLAALTVTISPATRELFVGDETKYSQVVREMRGGAWLVPHLEGEPYTHKPPLHFWGITALSYVTGLRSTWPFVLQSLLAYLLTILFVYVAGSKLFGRHAGVLAAFIYATMLLSWGTAQTARMDPTFVLLISIAIWCVWCFLEGEPRWRLFAAGAAVGAAILYKGPMALVIVGLAIAFERFRRRAPLRRGGWGWAMLIVAAVPLLWLIPALAAGGREYADELLIKQNVGRAVGSWVHRAPFWFYVPRIPATYFPWFVPVIAGVVAIWKRPADDAARDPRRFLLGWIAAVLIPFSLLSGKLDIYMLPAIVPASLLAAAFLAPRIDDSLDRITRWANRTVMLLLAGVGLAVPLVAARLLAGEEEAVYASDGRVLGFFFLLAAVSLVALVMSFARRFRSGAGVAILLACAWCVSLLWLVGPLMPLLNEESSSARLVRAIENQHVEPRTIALHRSPHLWSRGMSPELDGVRYVDAHEVVEADPVSRPQVIVTRRDKADELGDVLAGYTRVDSVRMIGKVFDVWRRR